MEVIIICYTASYRVDLSYLRQFIKSADRHISTDWEMLCVHYVLVKSGIVNPLVNFPSASREDFRNSASDNLMKHEGMKAQCCPFQDVSSHVEKESFHLTR